MRAISASRLYKLSFLFLLSVVPLAFSSKSYNFIYIKEIVFSAGVALLIVSVFLRKEFTIKKITLLPLLYLAWMALSTGLGKYHYAGLPAMASGAALFIFFLAVSNSVNDVGETTGMLAVTSVPFILAGLVQAFFPQFMKEFMVFGSRAPSLFGNPNFFCAYLAGITPVFARAAAGEKGVKRNIYIALIAAAIFCMIATGSKSAVIGLLFLAAVPIFLFTAKGRNVQGKLVITACLAALVIMLSVAFMGAKLSRITDPKEWARNESVFFRAYTWKGTLGIVRDNFLAGTGPGTFEIVYPRYRQPEIMQWSNEHSYETMQPENILLQAAAETGITGLIIFLFLFYIAVRGARRENCGFLAGLLSITLVNLVGVDMNYISSSMLAVLLAGVIVSGQEGPGFTLKAWKKVLFACAMAVIILAVMALQVRKYISGIYLKQAVFYSDAGQWNAAIDGYRQALSADKYNLTAQYFFAKACADSGAPDTALSEYSALEILAPDYVLLHYNKAELYSQKGAYDDAINEYNSMLAIDPYLKPALVDMAHIYIEAKKRPDEAEKYLKKAIDAFPGDASLYNNLGNVYFMSKRMDESVEAFKKAVDLKPDKDYYYNLGCVYFTMNDRKNARIYLEKAIGMDPNDQRVIKMIGLVERYGK